MKVRIVNDGKHGYSTKVLTEDGQELQYVSEVDIHIEASAEVPKVLLTMIYPIVDIIADAEIKHICPCCGRDMPVEEKEA